jgi:hypothetical protein
MKLTGLLRVIFWLVSLPVILILIVFNVRRALFTVSRTAAFPQT